MALGLFGWGGRGVMIIGISRAYRRLIGMWRVMVGGRHVYA